MGLLSVIIKELAADAAIKYGKEAIGNLPENFRIYKANELDRYQAKMESRNPGNRHIWMIEELPEKKSRRGGPAITAYRFFDTNGKTLYTAVNRKAGNLQSFTLYDDYNSLVGTVTELKSVRRNPFASGKSDMQTDFVMSFKNEDVGMVTNAVWRGKWFLVWDVVNWGAVRRKAGVSCIVEDDDSTVAEITTKKLNSRKLSFIDFSNEEREKAILLYALAIMAYGNRA